ncbi:MAG: hypothetical protein RJA29_2502 [Pseudomonadota bacterium]
MQCAHLVVHECNERRHHNADAQARLLPRNGRYLVAQAFAATCRHQHQCVLPTLDMFDDVLLWPSEGFVAKNLPEDTQDR